VILVRDNKTSQPAHEYDAGIRKTMPFYDYFHDTAIGLVEVINPGTGAWLDTGSGTGAFVVKAAAAFPGAFFTVADPSAAMLDIAKEKLSGITCCEYVPAGTELLDCAAGSFDVITAFLSHHYFDAEARRRATANCFRMLKQGGVYISFETILPNTEKGKQFGLECWRRAQLKLGKNEGSIDKYLSRYGVEFFPITLNDHFALLRDTGFSMVEVLWASGMQTGFYAMK
jgi:tRNA (cmo5U34)-methyltransferase